MARFRAILVAGALAVGMASGCAGVSPGQVAQTAGTIAGSIIAPGIGAPIGSLVGLLAGMVLQGHMDKVNEKKERVVLNDQLGGQGGQGRADSAPGAQGEPTRVWVDETMRDGRLMAGHFEVRTLP